MILWKASKSGTYLCVTLFIATLILVATSLGILASSFVAKLLLGVAATILCIAVLIALIRMLTLDSLENTIGSKLIEKDVWPIYHGPSPKIVLDHGNPNLIYSLGYKHLTFFADSPINGEYKVTQSFYKPDFIWFEVEFFDKQRVSFIFVVEIVGIDNYTVSVYRYFPH